MNRPKVFLTAAAVLGVLCFFLMQRPSAEEQRALDGDDIGVERESRDARPRSFFDRIADTDADDGELAIGPDGGVVELSTATPPGPPETHDSRRMPPGSSTGSPPLDRLNAVAPESRLDYARP